MKILAIDTSAVVASCALCEDDAPIAVYSQKAGLNHSQTMLPMVKNLMDNTGVSIDDIDMLAVSAGPGSFTGIRIGIATIKGLAFGKNKICVGVSTLEAMAKTAGTFATDAIICPVMDARRNQLYNAIFEIHGNTLLRLTEDRLIDAGELAKELDAMDKPVYFVGDGYDLITKMNLPFQRPTPPAYRWQNAYGVAQAARALYEKTEDKTAFTDTLLRPEYLRAPQAEREAAEREKATKNN
jgi:tRNA threonylcarbamoyladenosine biosynthesis protein TsaB